MRRVSYETDRLTGFFIVLVAFATGLTAYSSLGEESHADSPAAWQGPVLPVKMCLLPEPTAFANEAPTSAKSCETGLSLHGTAGEMLKLINRARQERGIPLLEADLALSRVSQEWAGVLALKREISHNGTHYAPGWISAGENVGKGSTVQQIFAAMYWEEMDENGRCLDGKTGAHCRNILEPRFNRIGLGDVASQGTHWTVQNFAEYKEVNRHGI